MEGKKSKKTRSAIEIQEKNQEEIETCGQNIKKVKTKKTKKNKEDIIVQDQDIENKKEKKKRKLILDLSEVTAEKTKSKTRKRSKSKSNNDTFLFSDHKTTVNMNTNEGWEDLVREENVELENDDNDDAACITERTKEKVKSSKKQRSKRSLKTPDKELSFQSNETYVDEDLEGKTKKKKRKKENMISENNENANTDREMKSTADQALLYLQMWKDDRSKWTFKKVRQVWLLKHMFDRSKIPDTDFEVLLLYLEGLQGIAKKTTISRAEALIELDDQKNPVEFDLERVKKILQILT